MPASGVDAPTSATSPTYFATAAEFRAWLAAHGDTESCLLAGFYKVGSGLPSMTWPESVDEALCFGWIDGLRKRIDEQRYQIRFTPRKSGSIWSRINIARAEALIAEGRMQGAGLAAYTLKIERRSGIYSYEQEQSLQLTRDELRAFKAKPAAWRWFEAQAPSWRRTITFWVVSAKQPATRARRLSRLIDQSAAGRRL